MNSISAWLLAALFLLLAVPATAAEWESYPGFFGPGHAGIAIGDYDGDGKSEAVVTGFTRDSYYFGGTQLLAVLSGDTPASLRVRSMSMLSAELIGPLVAAPREGQADRLVAVTSDGSYGRILVLGDIPVRVLRTIEAPLIGRVTSIADVDADGKPDIVALSNAGFSEGYPVVLDYETGAIKWTGSNLVSDIGVAELDGDAAGELIMAGTPGRIVDGVTHAVEWSYPSGFPGKILVGRFDVDPGVAGFAVAIHWSGIQVFRSQPYSPVSEFAQFEIGAASVARLNPGGPDQIAIGEGQWGNVSVWDPRSGQAIVSLPNPEHGVSAIAVGDIDADGHAELVYGAGLTSSGGDLLRAVDIQSQLDDYVQIDEIGPYAALVRGDLAGTGADQVAYLTVSSDSSYSGSNLRILDATNGTKMGERLNILGNPWANNAVPQILIAQMDSDPQKELIVGGSDYYAGVVAVVDGLSLEDQWRVADYGDWPIPDPVVAMGAIDANLDGVPDVVIATAAVRLMVLDGRNGAILWESVTLNGDTPPSIATFHDMAGAPNALLTIGTGIYVFNLQNHLLASSIKTSANVTGLLQWGDYTGCRFAILDEDSMVTVYRCPGMEVAGTYPVPPDTTFFRPIYNDDGPRFLVASGSRLYVSDADGISFPVSGNLGHQIGAGNLGVLRPGSDADHFDLVIGSDYMVTRITVSTLDVVFANGFE
jgi:hypothetical protein